MPAGRYYMRSQAMVSGGPFRCFNCNRLLIQSLTGSVYEISLECQRCNATIRVRCKEPIPFVGEQMTAEREKIKASASMGNGEAKT